MENFKLKSWVTASEEGAAFCAPTPSKVLGMRMTQQAALQYLTGTEQAATGGITYILFKHGEDLDNYLASVLEVLPDAIVLSISGDNKGWALTPTAVSADTTVVTLPVSPIQVISEDEVTTPRTNELLDTLASAIRSGARETFILADKSFKNGFIMNMELSSEIDEITHKVELLFED